MPRKKRLPPGTAPEGSALDSGPAVPAPGDEDAAVGAELHDGHALAMAGEDRHERARGCVEEARGAVGACRRAPSSVW